MVGLVLVSHSRALAEALVNLVRQVTTAEVPIAVAAGVGEGRAEFGTDAVEVMEAIQTVFSSDGVLVLMDLGSAVLSAEMALELLPPDIGEKVRFSPAPIVEGAIAAAVQSSLGSTIEMIMAEAQAALQPKLDHLGVETPESPVSEAVPDLSPTSQEVVLTLKNLHGLHARPAARFVRAAGSYNAEIRVTNLTLGKGPVSAKSLNGLATLGAVKDHQVRIQAQGPEAAAALQVLQELVESGFGELNETVSAPIGAAPPPIPGLGDGDRKMGVPISEGAAVGPLYRYQPVPPPIPEGPSLDPQHDWQRLENAILATQENIRQRRQALRASLGENQAAIFDAHLLILQDPDLLSQVKKKILEQHENPGAAWNTVIQETAASYSTLNDPYLSQRAADVRDVGNQVLLALGGKSASAAITFPKPVVLYAYEITPTETSQLDMSQVLAIITATGGPTSHSAILARALGIPAVTGIETGLENLPAEVEVAVDGFLGQVWIQPDSNLRAKILQRRQEWLDRRQKLLESSRLPAMTQDGQRIEVAANIGNLQDALAADKNGAEGIGLLRTEFLYLTRETPPSEAEQYASLKEIGEVLAPRPIIVRTLDVGGDKALPYIALPEEANPFLGVRAVRLSLRQPDLFLPQLKAILRAAQDAHFRVMFPMIANLDEVVSAKAWLEQAHLQLTTQKIPHAWPIETGIMVEIPSAALLSRSLARHVDFFSIGTNDLTQYTLAAERGNSALSGLADAMHPAVLRLISEVCAAAKQEGKWVGVCGELAGDPVAVPVLVGLGVRELSMNPASIPRAKAIIRTLNAEEAALRAKEVLQTDSPEMARQRAVELFQGLSSS